MAVSVLPAALPSLTLAAWSRSCCGDNEGDSDGDGDDGKTINPVLRIIGIAIGLVVVVVVAVGQPVTSEGVSIGI